MTLSAQFFSSLGSRSLGASTLRSVTSSSEKGVGRRNDSEVRQEPLARVTQTTLTAMTHKTARYCRRQYVVVFVFVAALFCFALSEDGGSIDSPVRAVISLLLKNLLFKNVGC